MDLAYCINRPAVCPDQIQHGILRRCHRVVATIRSPYSLSVRLQHIRPCDDSAAGIFTVKQPTRFLTYAVKFLKRNDIHVGRHLEHAVRRSIDDHLTGLFMFLPQLLDDLRSRCSAVAQPASACLP